MKGVVKKFGLIIGGVVIGCMAAEATARFISPVGGADLLFNAPDASPRGLYVLEKDVRVVPAPNFSAKIKSLDYEANLQTNALGLRGPDPSLISQRQWLALGDSFTMAVQVSEADTFAGQLGQLNDTHVWNAGVDGYSTFQSALRAASLKEELAIERFVLLFFTGNDFQDNERFLAMKNQPLPGNVGDPIPRAPVSAASGFFLRHSHLYAHYRIHQRQRQIADGTDHSLQNWKDELRIFTTQGSNRLKQLSHRTKEALQRLKEAAGATPLMVAVAPPAFVIDTKRMEPTFTLVGLDPEQAALEAPQKEILELLMRLDVAHCDLSTALHSGQKEEAMYFDFDGHWTRSGHRVVAEAIHTCIGAGK